MAWGREAGEGTEGVQSWARRPAVPAAPGTGARGAGVAGTGAMGTGALGTSALGAGAALAGRVLSVADLTRRVRARVESDPGLARVLVKGEVSAFRRHTSGHLYFTLKDEVAQIRCVMFRSRAGGLRGPVGDGVSVIAFGSVGVYEAGGQYQLYVEVLFPAGLGELYAAVERLRRKLEAEGLFDPARKRPLPLLPRRVGVVTSPVGAAIRDVITVSRRRFPKIDLLVAPAQVQGEQAPRSLIRAIEDLQASGLVDVIIVGRGGGSPEELAAFNDEGVVRAIAACRVPVVSAVGHETDVTLADLAADRRAPTPSAAAELVVPLYSQLQADLRAASHRLAQGLVRRVRLARERLELLTRSPVLRRPEALLQQRRQRVDELSLRLAAAIRGVLRDRRAQAEGLAGRLDALSPLATLARGYAAVLEGPGGALVRSVRALRPGQRVQVVLSDGSASARVEEVHPDVAQGDRA